MSDAPDANGYFKDAKRALSTMAGLREKHEAGREYYEGTRAEVAASIAVRKLIKESAQAHPIALAHIPVDTIADKVVLASLTSQDKAADLLLQSVATSNDLDDEFDDWVTKACYFGDYYAIVDPRSEDNNGQVLVDDLRLVGSSPLSTIVVYDSSDDRTPLYGLKRWRDSGDEWRARLYYDDVTVKLATKPGTKEPKAEDYLVDDGGEEGGELIAHDGGQMLVRHLAIDGKPYGRPVHTRAYGPQDAITKISATNLVNVDGQGFASRWALADPMAEIDDDIDDDFGTDGPGTQTAGGTGAQAPDGQLKATTGSSRVRSIPGSIALLKGIVKVGQFDQTTSDDFLKNLDWYVRVMAVATGTPLFEFDLTGEQPSGESRRRAEGRVINKARKVQRASGAFLEHLADVVLSTLGKENVDTVAAFRPLETSTDKDGLELVGLKIANGVPVRIALLEAGYTPEQVADWWPDSAPAVTIDMLTTLGTALAQLGNALTLGVITDVELRNMLPTILTGARGEGGSAPTGA